MYLFLNTITKPVTILLFSNEKRIVATENFDVSGREYDELLERIEYFLSDNSLSVERLDGITVVCGPGGFTSTRIISLIVNTWKSLYGVPTQSLTLFDAFELAGGDYPMCVKANRGEYLILESKIATPTIYSLVTVPDGNYVGIGDISDFENQHISIQSLIDYEKLILNFKFLPTDKNIEPYYIKKPNIT